MFSFLVEKNSFCLVYLNFWPMPGSLFTLPYPYNKIFSSFIPWKDFLFWELDFFKDNFFYDAFKVVFLPSSILSNKLVSGLATVLADS